MCICEFVRFFTPKSWAAVAFSVMSATALAGPITVTTTANSGAGSLRNAIMAANGAPGPNEIRFSIGMGPATITITSALPPITDTVFINGASQPGFSGTPLIRIDGPGAGTGDGLLIMAPSCEVRALSITRFAMNGIHIQGASAKIQGCFIGVDQTGLSTGTGNTTDGVLVDFASGAIIGTDSDGTDDGVERNVVSLNGAAGIHLTGSTTSNCVVAGNLIGVNAVGLDDRGNIGPGVAITMGARDNLVGTNGNGINDAGERNLISANGVGVSLGSMALRNKIAGNYIGTTLTGEVGLSNMGHGIYSLEASTNLIGTDSSNDMFNESERNVIAYNIGDGIRIENSAFIPTLGTVVAGNAIGTAAGGLAPLSNTGNGVTIIGAPSMSSHRIGSNGDNVRDELEGNIIAFNGFFGVAMLDTPNPGLGAGILTNSIHGNGDLGIDLLADGITPNDVPLDPDTGPNELQNFPELLDVSPEALVSFQLESLANATFRLEFFLSENPDAIGFGEGKRFAGAINVTTNGSGQANGNFQINLPSFPPTFRWVTTTATLIDQGPQVGTGGFFGKTSEFSLAVLINGPPIANPQTVTTPEDTDITITLTSSDPENDPLTFAITQLPALGQLRQFNGTPIVAVPANVTDGQRRVIFRPAPNDFGTPYTTFQFKVNDGNDDSTPATVTINVTAVNDEPTADPQTVNTLEDVTATITLTGSDPDGSALTARIVSLPAQGELRQFGTMTPILAVPTDVTDPNRRVLFVPDADENGTPYANFDFILRNVGGSVSAAATVTVNVTPVNDPPDFQVPAEHQSLEDAGPVSVPGFATGITVGPPDESGQTAVFNILSNSNSALFSALPALAPNGTLTYTAAPNAFGSATIQVGLVDDGGTANGGNDTSVTRSFIINVLPVNDPPDFAITAEHNSLEDAGAQSVPTFAFNITVGPANESAQTAAFSILSNSNPSLFSAAPAISATGTLTYTAAANAFGSATIQVNLVDSGGTANGGNNTSTTRSFSINVGPVNDPPNFDITAEHNSLEDAGSQSVPNFAFNISVGPANEAGQTVAFTILSNTNPGLFSAAPAISPTGTLTYTATANTFGTATVEVRIQDDGGTANGGNDTGPTRSFVINVGPVNDPPSFNIQPLHSSPEDAGAQTVPNFAFDISPGPPDESGQTVVFQILTNSNPSLFIAPPSLSPTGTLTYTAGANQFGTATIQVNARDNGGTANGGQDTSATQSFQIEIRPVNDAPSFTAVDPPAVLENSGSHSGIQIVTTSSTGPANESGQTLSYLVSAISNPGLFSSPPAVNGLGQLSYTPAANVFGTSTFVLRARDNGGTSDGGIDTSGPQTLTIKVRPQARCRDHVIDASTTCPDLMIQPGDVNVTPADPTGGDPEYFVSNLGPFSLGPPTPVLVTVHYRVDDLTSTCTAFVTVLGGDCNGNGVPDTCDIAGGEIDCDGNMVPDFCECFWNNGTAPTQGLGQLSHIGGGAGLGARVADDFVLEPGYMHHITRFSGTMYTNSNPYLRRAKIQFFEECNGRPDETPFLEFTDPVTAEPAGPPGPDGFTRVHYVFDLCDADLWLEGGKSYWVSLIGISDGANEDLSFWAATSTAPIPDRLIASVPRKAEGTGIHTFGPWEPLDECCIGCVNMAFELKGGSCPLLWDNGPPDLAQATAGGSLSGAAGLGRTARTADNFATKTCNDETVCYIDAFIWTNCSPPIGFLELYDNECNEPGENPIPLRIATPSRVIATLEQVTINGVIYDGYQLQFTDLDWVLEAGRTYWLSAGASGTGDISPRSFFAYRDECPECPIRIEPGATRTLLPIRTEWEPTTRDYAFRVAVMDRTRLIRGQGTTPPLPCPADIDRSGTTTVQDLFDFLAAWFTGCP